MHLAPFIISETQKETILKIAAKKGYEKRIDIAKKIVDLGYKGKINSAASYLSTYLNGNSPMPKIFRQLLYYSLDEDIEVSFLNHNTNDNSKIDRYRKLTRQIEEKIKTVSAEDRDKILGDLEKILKITP